MTAEQQAMRAEMLSMLELNDRLHDEAIPHPQRTAQFAPGDVVHGFAGGSFGRDSYACRRIEAVGPDWIVTRNHEGQVEMAAGHYLPTAEEANDRAWCFADCDGLEDQAMTDAAPPIWLLDVDGVINVFQPSWGVELTRAKVGFPVRYSQPLIDRIRAIHNSGVAEIRWSTTWCGWPDQLAELGAVLNLPLPPAFGDRPPSKTWADLKVEAALAVLDEGRRLIWTDDGEVEAARRLFPALARAEFDGQALLIAPDSILGLQPEHIDAIEMFATVLSAAVR